MFNLMTKIFEYLLNISLTKGTYCYNRMYREVLTVNITYAGWCWLVNKFVDALHHSQAEENDTDHMKTVLQKFVDNI